VRLEEHGGAQSGVGLGLVQPAQFGDGLRRLRHTPHRLGPRLAPAERVDEVGRGDLRALVAAGHGGTDGVALGVEGHDGVLLRRHADGLHALEETAAGGFTEGEEPRLGIDVGCAAAAFHRVRGIPLLEHGTGVCVADDDASEIG